MKIKIVIAVLSTISAVSVGSNIYQYNIQSASKQQLSDTQAQLDSMTKNYADLDAQITAMQEEIDSLNTSISDKQSEIDSLTQENNDLMSRVSVEDGVGDEADVEVEEPTESIVAVEPSESDKTNNAQPDVDYRVPNDFTYADGYWVDGFGYKYVHVDNHWEDEYGNRIYMEGYEEGIEYVDVPNNGEGREWSEEYLDALRAITVE